MTLCGGNTGMNGGFPLLRTIMGSGIPSLLSAWASIAKLTMISYASMPIWHYGVNCCEAISNLNLFFLAHIPPTVHTAMISRRAKSRAAFPICGDAEANIGHVTTAKCFATRGRRLALSVTSYFCDIPSYNAHYRQCKYALVGIYGTGKSRLVAKVMGYVLDFGLTCFRLYIISRIQWKVSDTWWRHQMETFSALLAICAGIHRSPATRSFDVFFDLCLNLRLSKQS